MRYKCLILDHDDTVVDSTRTVNYLSFSEVLEEIRPDLDLSLDDFFKLNFDPGFMAMCLDILKFTPEEMTYQEDHWRKFISNHNPSIFPGMKDLLWDYVDLGGKIFVVSHSTEKDILRHYSFHKLPGPEKVYGWEYEVEKRKPNPWPIEDIIENHGFDRRDILMVDDLKPGQVMADKANISFAAAGWAHDIAEIKNYMMKEADYYCQNIADLRKIII